MNGRSLSRRGLARLHDVLRAHVDRLPETERAGFVRAVADRLVGRDIDYVRLNIQAGKG